MTANSSESVARAVPAASDDRSSVQVAERAKPRAQAIVDSLTTFSMTGVSLVAGLCVGIEVVTRAIAPCLRGLAIGLDAWINRASFIVDTLTLTLMVAAFALGAIQVTAIASSRTPLALRALAMLGAGITMLVMLAAPSSDHPPLPLLVTSAAASSTLALVAAGVGLRDKVYRLPAIAGIGVAIGTTARTASVFFAARAAAGPRSEALDPARVLATVGFGADALVLLAVAAWAVSRSRKLALPLVVGALGLAVLGARWAVVAPDDTSALAMIVRLGTRMMMSRPVPFVPYPLEIFGVLFAFLLAAVTLAIPRQTRALSGALALFAVVRSTGEVPLHASLVAVATLGLVLTQFSPKSFWSSVPDATPLK